MTALTVLSEKVCQSSGVGFVVVLWVTRPSMVEFIALVVFSLSNFRN